MKIENKTLSDFIKKAGVNSSGDTFAIKQCIMDFTDQGVVVEAIDDASFTMVTAVLNKTAFTSYNPIGRVGINNLHRLKKMIDRCEGELTFNKKDNLLVFSTSSRQFDFVLPHTDTIKETSKRPQLDYDVAFDVESKFFNNILKNAEIVEKGASLKFLGNDKKLVVESGSDDKSREILEVPELTQEIKVKFGEPFKNIIPVLNEKVNVAIKSDYPIKIISKDEFMSVTYVIAPMTFE